MNSNSALQLLNDIDKTLVDISKISGKDVLTDSFLAKFLVVYICGIYEETIETILVDFVKKHSSRLEVVEYARTTIDESFRNPDGGKLIGLSNKLGNSTLTSVLKGMSNERIALDSIVNNKNDLAHGRGSTTTLADVKGYYASSRKLIEAFDTYLF